MNSRPPFIGQERPDTCMLACLRMILAHRGLEITEEILVRQVALTEGGLDPENLAQLAKRYDCKLRRVNLTSMN